MEAVMKYALVTLILFLFTVPIAIANGGPAFKQLHEQSYQGTQIIELIGQSGKHANKKKVCLINIGQGKVKKRPC